MAFPTKRWRFNRAILEHAPEHPGIFVLWDGDEVIYIGSTRHGTAIKAVLLEHQDGQRGECTRRATHYSWEIHPRPSAREAELLAEFGQLHSRDPRCQKKMA